MPNDWATQAPLDRAILILFVYLTERDTVREGTQAGGVGEGEAGFLQSREPNVGLDPRTLGS